MGSGGSVGSVGSEGAREEVHRGCFDKDGWRGHHADADADGSNNVDVDVDVGMEIENDDRFQRSESLQMKQRQVGTLIGGSEGGIGEGDGGGGELDGDENEHDKLENRVAEPPVMVLSSEGLAVIRRFQSLETTIAKLDIEALSLRKPIVDVS